MEGNSTCLGDAFLVLTLSGFDKFGVLKAFHRVFAKKRKIITGGIILSDYSVQHFET